MPNLRYFLLYFLPVSLLVTASILFVFHKQKQLDIELVEKRESTKLQLAKDNIRDFYEPLVYNVDYLAQRQIVKDFLAGKLHNKALIEEDLVNIMEVAGDYDQMRLLSMDGLELIRVNKSQDSVYVQNDSLLQNKAHRDYVKRIKQLKNQNTFVGAIDLNIEYGAIEIPHKPVIRVGKIVRNEVGEPLGLVVTNYWMANYLEKIDQNLTGRSEVMLLTAIGDFISGPDKYPKFAHLVETDSLGFPDYYPSVWKQVENNEEGALLTDEGLFSFSRITAKLDNREQEDRMIILSYVNTEQLASTYTYAKSISILALIFVNLLIAWASYLLAKSRTILKTQVQEKTEELDDLNARHKGIFDNAFQFIWLLEPNGTLIEANKTALDFIGAKLEDVKGKNFIESPWFAVGDEARKKLRQAVQTAASGQFIRYDTQNVGADGRIIWVDFSLRPVYENGEVKYLVPEGRDISDKVELQKQQKELELRFQGIFDNTFQFIGLLEPDGTLIEANKTALDFGGFTMEQARGLKFYDAPWWSLSEATKNQLKDAIKRAAKGEFIRYDVAVKGVDEIRTIDFSLRPIFENGEVKYLVPEGRDITEKLELEKQKRESEERFRQLYETIDEGIVYQSAEGGIIEGNASAERVLGITVDQMNGRTFLDPRWKCIGVDGSDFPGESHPAMVALKTGKIIKGVTMGVLHPKEENYVWLSVSSYPVFKKGDSTPHLVYSTFEDITAEHLANESLKKSRTRFQLAAEGASVGLWDWMDITTKEVWWSPRFYELLGYENNEIPAGFDSFEELMHPDDKAPMYQQIENHLAGKGAYYIEYRLRTKDGHYRWFLGTGQAKFDESGQAIRMVGSIMDIHQQKTFEQELERKVEERTKALKEANKELEGFSYSVSHDLRAPLRAVNGFAEILEEDYADKLDAEGRETVKVIRNSAQQMGTLIDDLLRFSRLGRQEMNKVSVDMNKLLKEVIDLERAANKLDKHKLVTQDLPKTIGDPGLLKQLWANLISNAFKYSSNEENPVVEIGSEVVDGQTKYYVKDNGVGFKQAYAEKMFGVFQRLHSEKEFPGTGVGLALAYRIVKRHNGKIWAEAEEGRGAIFYFTLNN